MIADQVFLVARSINRHRIDVGSALEDLIAVEINVCGRITRHQRYGILAAEMGNRVIGGVEHPDGMILSDVLEWLIEIARTAELVVKAVADAFQKIHRLL